MMRMCFFSLVSKVMAFTKIALPGFVHSVNKCNLMDSVHAVVLKVMKIESVYSVYFLTLVAIVTTSSYRQ